MSDLVPIALTFIVAGIVIAIGINILADTRDGFGETSCSGRSDAYTTYNATSQQCQNGTNTQQLGVNDPGYFNATIDAVNGTGELADKLPLLGLVVAAALVIFVMVRSFQV